MILLRHGQSHFNLHFGRTRQDPGIVDPSLTDEGRRQASDAAARLAALGVERLIASPYRRTLETAEIVATALELTITIEPLVREHAYFSCDIGSPRSVLEARWPEIDFGELPEHWWPETAEEESDVLARCNSFRDEMAARENWAGVAVVSHWGFIRGLTGHQLANGAAVRFDPSGRAESQLLADEAAG